MSKIKIRYNKEKVICPYVEKGKSICTHPTCIRLHKRSCWIYRKKMRLGIVRTMKGNAKVKHHGN